jgi:hypothetical protein
MYTFNGFERGKRIVQKSGSPLLASIQDGTVPTIPVIKRGKGPYLYDYDGNRYVDFFLSGGSLIFGHSNPGLTTVAKSWMSRGYAAGYPTVSHDVLSRRCETVLHNHLRDSGGKWFFFDSVSDAIGTIARLVHTGGIKSMFVADGDTPAGLPAWGPAPKRSLKQADEWLKQELQFLILHCGRHIHGDAVSRLLKKADTRRLIVITDETAFSSFIHTSSLKVEVMPGIRIFGAWLGGGLDFGAIYLKKELFPEKKLIDMLRDYRERVSGIGFPPLYKLKVALKFLKLLETAGGISELQKRYSRFATMFDPSVIETIDGLPYLKRDLSSYYPVFRKKLIERGLLLPLNISDHLSLSFAHEGGLLDKGADVINAVSRSVVRESTKNDTG